ncbi:MAG TPA: hypothetical protein DCM14_08475 [Clostridiales bacterium UBA8153]|nr:hypothetical protein [Clostridiales bacterium UBA8153]
MAMKLALGSDHRGYRLKEAVKASLAGGAWEVTDLGTCSGDAVDYPGVALVVAEGVACGKYDRGLLFCGTGIGMTMAANKVPGVRAAGCHDVESARASRAHNDANVLALGSLEPEAGQAVVAAWLEEPFAGGRHARRKDQIAAIDAKYRVAPDTGWDLADIRSGAEELIRGLLAVARLRPGQILVLGCSTSEIRGEHIGSSSDPALAAAVLGGALAALDGSGVYLAVQCCEHLNRSLVVPEAAVEQYGLTPVWVLPVPGAGGATAAAAMAAFDRPVVVEAVAAHAGLDIGDTIIGMHLRPVAVPVRLSRRNLGQAHVTLARTRPRLVGGQRAVYAPEQMERKLGGTRFLEGAGKTCE